jgi:RNA polymerase sigma factor (sigma-70 family)
MAASLNAQQAVEHLVGSACPGASPDAVAAMANAIAGQDATPTRDDATRIATEHGPSLTNTNSPRSVLTLASSATELMDEARPRIIGLAVNLFHDRMTAEVVYQETWVVIWRNWETVSVHPNPMGLVLTTAKHICRRLQALEDAQRRVERRLASMAPETPTQEDFGDRDRIERVIAALPPRQREAFIYRYYLDFTTSEIADAMGIRPGTVKALLNQAHAKLRGLAVPEDQQGDKFS